MFVKKKKGDPAGGGPARADPGQARKSQKDKIDLHRFARQKNKGSEPQWKRHKCELKASPAAGSALLNRRASSAPPVPESITRKRKSEDLSASLQARSCPCGVLSRSAELLEKHQGSCAQFIALSAPPKATPTLASAKRMSRRAAAADKEKIGAMDPTVRREYGQRIADAYPDDIKSTTAQANEKIVQSLNQNVNAPISTQRQSELFQQNPVIRGGWFGMVRPCDRLQGTMAANLGMGKNQRGVREAMAAAGERDKQSAEVTTAGGVLPLTYTAKETISRKSDLVKKADEEIVEHWLSSNITIEAVKTGR